jgi:hypothetical protein
VAGYRRCERTSDLTSKLRAIALPDDEHVAWVRDESERIRPFSTGSNYVNFPVGTLHPALTPCLQDLQSTISLSPLSSTDTSPP